MGVNKSVFLVLMMLHTNQQVSNTSTTRNINRITAKVRGSKRHSSEVQRL